MSDLKRDNDNHTFVFALGKGKGLGKIENVRWSWRKLKRKLFAPSVDASVTYAQYKSLDNDAKLAKKRAPGAWTPSRYKGTNRVVVDLRQKTLIAYDLDEVTPRQLEDIQMGLVGVAAYAWAMHSTRGHSPEEPRARMIFPVTRPMKPDEAHAVFRLLALELADDPEEAIEIPDLVSFRGNQTMFWPSISNGQEFITDENVAPILDVDAFLAKHGDWDNFENLPYSSKEMARGKTDPDRRMEDPWKKEGAMGGFCRCYTVQEVIQEFLPEVYTPADSESGEERYSFIGGTSSNGAVVYEGGKFLQSFHGSDPVETNHAFDLCRLHMFGHLDSEAHHNTSPGNMPSFKSMQDFARHDPRVRADMNSHMDDMMDDLEGLDEDEKSAENEIDDLLGPTPSAPKSSSSEKSGDLGDTLDDLDDGEAEESKEDKHAWRGDLRNKPNGDLDGAAVSNIALILENDPRFKDRIGFNLFTNEPVCMKPIRTPKINLPSRRVMREDRKYGRGWQDADDLSIQLAISANAERHGYETDFSRPQIETGVLTAGMANSFHPIQDLFTKYHEQYVNSGRASKGLIDQLPQTYLGCPDDVFHRESSRMVMTALAARVFEPGIKFDIVTILRGDQGGRKSGFWRALAHGFFSELPKDFERTDKMVESMQGNLISELGEMAGLRRDTAEIAKEFITRQADKIRLAYARRVGIYPRQSILGGTSNLDEILHDPTGNRRFWIWQDKHTEDDPIAIADLEAALPMLWGEAYDNYLKLRKAKPRGELWLDLHSKEARKIRDRLADQHRALGATEILAELILEWMDEEPSAANFDETGDDMAEVNEDEVLVRSMACAEQAMTGLKGNVAAEKYHNADVRTYGKALKHLHNKGALTFHGKCRRHGFNRQWYVRLGCTINDPLWIEAPKEEDAGIDNMLS